MGGAEFSNNVAMHSAIKELSIVVTFEVRS